MGDKENLTSDLGTAGSFYIKYEYAIQKFSKYIQFPWTE